MAFSSSGVADRTTCLNLAPSTLIPSCMYLGLDLTSLSSIMALATGIGAIPSSATASLTISAPDISCLAATCPANSPIPPNTPSTGMAANVLPVALTPLSVSFLAIRVPTPVPAQSIREIAIPLAAALPKTELYISSLLIAELKFSLVNSMPLASISSTIKSGKVIPNSKAPLATPIANGTEATAPAIAPGIAPTPPPKAPTDAPPATNPAVVVLAAVIDALLKREAREPVIICGARDGFCAKAHRAAIVSLSPLRLASSIAWLKATASSVPPYFCSNDCSSTYTSKSLLVCSMDF